MSISIAHGYAYINDVRFYLTLAPDDFSSAAIKRP